MKNSDVNKFDSDSVIQRMVKIFKSENQKAEQLVNSRIEKLEKKFIETQEQIIALIAAETQIELKNNSKKLEQVISLLTGERP